MPTVPSKSATQLVKYITSVCSSALGLTITHPAATFFANQIDAAADLAKAGAKVSPENLVSIFALKTLSIAGLSDDERVKCGAAMAAFGLNLGGFAAEAAVTPGDPLIAPALYVQAFSVVSAYYGAQHECAPIVQRYVQDAADGMMQLEYSLYQWVEAQRPSQ